MSFMLYIDLEKAKSTWREELHPRDKYGKFTTVKGGSRIVTRTGKTGLVHRVTDTHYHVTAEDGSKFSVVRGNAIHFNDHAKATAEAKKRTRKTKKSTAKAKVTKETNKANATGATGAAKKLTDPTAKSTKKAAPTKKVAPKASEAKKTDTKPKTERRRVPKDERPVVIPKKKLERDMAAPVLKRNVRHDMEAIQEVKQTIPKNPTRATAEPTSEQNVAMKDRVENKLDEAQATDINTMWNSPDVQAILSKPVNKRSAEDIQRVAGAITDANDKLSRHLVHNMAASRGLQLVGRQHLLKRHLGGKRSAEGKREARQDHTVRQDTGVYGDLMQSARASMYQTIHNVLAGSQNPGQGTAIGAHIAQRVRQQLHRDIYDFMNDIPAPHEIRSAIGAMKGAEGKLTQELGRMPTHSEVADYLEANSEHFRSAPITMPPQWDEEKQEWAGTNRRYENPSEKLQALKNYAAQQKTTTIDQNVGVEGEREVTIADSMHDRTGASLEQGYIERERQQELREALPKVMRDIGLSDDEIRALAMKHSQASETGSKSSLTDKEAAEKLNAMYGTNLTSKMVTNLRESAMRKLNRAKEQKHPALQQLMLLKSLLVKSIMKAMYEYDLVKSLSSWGVDITVLEQSHTKDMYADSIGDLRKSMAPHEYIGSYVTLDDGAVVAKIVEWALPDNNSLYKSFNAYMTGLKKSMFPHRGGGNHAVNEKAKAYIKANGKRYASMSEVQHKAAKSKGGNLTWSQELLLKNPGSAWITWGGKKILVNSATGDVLYDSANEAHREERNQGAQEDKLEFHHEKDALDEHETEREKATRDAWKTHVSDNEAKAARGKSTIDYGKVREDFAKRNRGVSFDEDGNLQFQRDAELTDDNRHLFDHGIQAFRGDMEKWRDEWKVREGNRLVGGLVKDFLDEHSHKSIDAYADLSDEERTLMDGQSAEENVEFLGKHFLAKEGVQDALQKYHDAYKSGEPTAELEEEVRGVLAGLGSAAGRNKAMMTSFLNDVTKYNPSSEGNMDELASSFGRKEMSRAREEAGKNLLPEGKYMLGNPVTGKTMIVEVSGALGKGGRAGKGGKYASIIAQAFDPSGRAHLETDADGNISWGSLGKALEYTGKDADNLKAILTQFANTDPDKPFMKKISDEEFDQHRAKTAAGLRDTMLHGEFKLVDQQRDKDGNITGQTFAQKMEDGTTNHISVDGEGMIQDPLMQRLLNQRAPITNEKELNELLKEGVGNRTWVTAHFGSDIHIGDALGHHVQLEYDGKGAPRIVGGKYDGYRYLDQSDVPKGTLDPATGEPVKALFKNGKLVDRRYTTTNKVDMKEGNAVIYPNGSGGWRKGRIHQLQGDNVKVTDGKGNVIGMFKKSDLKNATEEGRMLSNSGNAVVGVAQTGTHRMNVDEAFADAKPKTKELFAQALRKAKVNSAFDGDGNLKKELELSDAMHRRLRKVLGRSKAGKAMLQKFNSAYTKELEIHVPESLRGIVSDEGVSVRNDGRARISAGKFEQLRDVLASGEGGLSLTHEASSYMKEHFSRKDRKPKSLDELRSSYQPSTVKTDNPEFDKQYKAQFNSDSYLMNPKEGLYSTQLEGIGHLVERGQAIAGHGMGTGKTILGVVAALKYKAEMLANGQTPKKTLIVAPKGIMTDWGKEIGSHTNSKALYIGGSSTFKGAKRGEDGKRSWGEGVSSHEVADTARFKRGSHADGDHDFHIVNYDTFMRNREHFANSGAYDNIVIDEVHAFKNQKGQRGTALAETTGKFKNVWGLSGTPMENDAREAYSLINTVTGGRHELGSLKEFTDNYMQKDRNGKIVGVRASKAQELGDIMANVIQFRGGEDVKYNDNTSIQFPNLAGSQSSNPNDPPAPSDFIDNMVDRSRDHVTNNYYGTKHSITDFDVDEKEVVNPKNGEKYKVTTTTPKNMTPEQEAMYTKYKEIEEKYLPESKRAELASAAATGIDSGKKDGGNYLVAMQKLQKFINAPLSHKMYVGGGDALDSSATDVQGAKAGAAGLKQYDPKTGEGHYNIDKNGFKRYFESDGKGGYLKDANGNPRELPPLHHNNPKAQYLQDRVHQYLDNLRAENKERVKRGQAPIVPKLVVKSSYTTFGTDIVDNVLKDVRNTHPIFKDLSGHGVTDIGQGRFTGDADDREDTKIGFRGDKNDYASNQGNLWATSVSPAGKEGVDFGNAHFMLHFDQDWNPQKMAQFTARVRRSDSWKTHQQMGRANSVRVESLHMPNTIEDFLFNAQDTKIKGVEQLTESTKTAEKVPKLGDTQGSIGRGHRGFTTRKRPRKPKESTRQGGKASRPASGGGELPKAPAASADKALKLVILL